MQKLTEIKNIFYDFDGVIKDSLEVKTEAFFQMYLPYGKEIAEKVKEHHLAHGGISRYQKFEIYHREFLDQQIDSRRVNELADIFSRLVYTGVIESDYVKGALESIRELRYSYKQFIITGTPEDEMRSIANELDISDCFLKICGSPAKKTEIGRQLFSEYSLKPEETVFIGDATTDYDAAINLKTHFILREHAENIGYFEGVNHIHRVKNLSNLAQILKTL